MIRLQCKNCLLKNCVLNKIRNYNFFVGDFSLSVSLAQLQPKINFWQLSTVEAIVCFSLIEFLLKQQLFQLLYSSFYCSSKFANKMPLLCLLKIFLGSWLSFLRICELYRVTWYPARINLKTSHFCTWSTYSVWGYVHTQYNSFSLYECVLALH